MLNRTTYLTARQQHQPFRNHWFNQDLNTASLVSCFRQFVISEKNVSVNKKRNVLEQTICSNINKQTAYHFVVL